MADEAREPIALARIQRLFERARVVGADDFLQREVGRRLIERLATVRVEVRQVLDLGSGDGGDIAALRKRFADASICELDVAGSRVAQAASQGRGRGIGPWLRRSTGPYAVQADFAVLPFAAQRFDMLWSNLALHWSSEPHRVLPEWSRVMRTGGLVAFSAFGPDTLAEVRDAFRAVDDDAHTLAFTDMHDYGDMLVAAGFTTPVVDVERLTLTYSTAESFWTDVRSLGGHPVTRRFIGLRGRDFGSRLDAALERTRDSAGRYRLTFELIFAHAWKAEPRTTRDGETIVRFERQRS